MSLPDERRAFARMLADEAAERLFRLRPHLCAKGGATLKQRLRFAALFLSVVTLAVLSFYAFQGLVLAFGAFWLFCLYCLKIASGVKGLPHLKATPEFDERFLPSVALLVPLYREEEVVADLLRSLDALDYPRERLEVLMLLEEDDLVTQTALQKLALPPSFKIIIIPDQGVKTKPKALNYGLNFTEAAIIGIYDAEDRPERDQIKIAACALTAAPRDVVAVQGRLAYDNYRHNLLTRLFALEYALWFDIMLPGQSRLGLPVPLGGTSVFLRAGALRGMGSWDAYNVTEDADLGMRIVRHGWRVELIPSTTWEEAAFTHRAWIKQRSRWIKGFLQTWLVHTRDRRALRREIDLLPACALEVMLLGGVISHALLPFIGVLLYFLPGDSLLGQMAYALLWIGLAGQGISPALAFIAGRKRYGSPLALWAVVLPFYWLMAAPASYIALYELIKRPSYWNKTTHGLTERGGFSAPAEAARAHQRPPKQTRRQRRRRQGRE